MSFKKTIKRLYKILEIELSSDLTYHGIHHTHDVHEVCQFYVKHYDIKKNDAQLLDLAAVGHDIGFTKSYNNHEEVSVEITADIMKSEGFAKKEILQVSEMIIATRSHNILSLFSLLFYVMLIWITSAGLTSKKLEPT